MNRDDYIEVNIGFGCNGLVKKDSIIAVCDIEPDSRGINCTTEVVLANGKIFVFEDYSKFCSRLFAPLKR